MARTDTYIKNLVSRQKDAEELERLLEMISDQTVKGSTVDKVPGLRRSLERVEHTIERHITKLQKESRFFYSKVPKHRFKDSKS